MPNQLRHLFIMILIHCEIAEPTLLLQKFEKDLMDDILYKFEQQNNFHPQIGSEGILFYFIF
jgi:hypothetical protein